MATATSPSDTALFIGRPTFDFELIKGHLASFGIQTQRVNSGVEALAELATSHFVIVMLDDSLPEHAHDQLLAELGRTLPDLPLVMLGNQGTKRIRACDLSRPRVTPLAQLSKPVSLLQLDTMLVNLRAGVSADV